MLEHFFQCPHCWEEISMLLDRSVNQTYIEDCEVCCNPIEITVKFEGENLVEFRTEILDQ
ncbi:CPXCG motif-containing cysteine-rich protein [Mesonia ostreae]|uniref:CPXCG motif-containing cysteine-rich protein n=1 Tax=Mesonia ostreae TaxID=861110 RepID=A0ABU2KFR4_9FLAO|nr:CPXCG motif-containing cysteine-rich protein [Mesonia ostreae]MDT0293514.1 CPXCG motif-containing cysteine-rich protein [Mesonia ostreae]